MSFLRRFGLVRDREADALRQRVSTLQETLDQHAEADGRRREFRRKLTAAIAVLVLALGIALAVYREPIQQAVTGPAQTPTGPAREAPDLDADAAYKKGDYATVLRLAGPLAAAGDARAQSMLGLLYYNGLGVPMDHKEAMNWFRRAADQDDADAEFYLGALFSEGQGVPLDYAEAAKWYRLAADRGHAKAQYNLGHFYAEGHAGERDNVSAYVWFNLAAAHFPTSDVGNVAAAVDNRSLMATRMTPDQITEAQKRTREWKPR
jgi:TPR repeat protein